MNYARTAVTRMTLDMSRPDLQRSEAVTLGDTNRRWEVTLINGGAPFRLPPNWTAALTGIKPDGNGLQNGCSVVDGKIIYDFAAGKEIATCVGSYPVQFDIWDEVGDLVASPKLYVNVLADVRPHAELDSEGQYTLIGDLIGRVNQTDADVDLLGETALAQGDAIAALKEKVTTAGSVTIPTTEWSDDTPRTARFKINGFVNGMTALLYPSDEETRKEASRVKLSAHPQLYMGTDGSQVEIVVSSAEVVPTKALYIDYIIIKTDNTNARPRVALIGVDAYGEGEGTGSGVDETAVRAIITAMLGNVDNEQQYSASNPPPYPVTSVNGKTGAVNLYIPSKASDVGADPAGTASSKLTTHNVDTASHADLRVELQRLADRLNAALNSTDTSLDDLKEIVAYIKANKTLIDGITSSKVNVTDIVNNLTTNTANVPLSAAQGVSIKLLIDNLAEIVDGKVTADQVAAQIKAALTDYLTKEEANKTYQPKEEGKGLSANDYTDEDKAVVTKMADKLAEAVEPAEDDIPKFFFGGALPQTKTEWVMPFRYISKTQDISGYCETKAQGNSSMAHPKKNQTVKFFKDEACTEKLKVDFKGWGKENKYCFKANWIDLTHSRNVVSARLWADVVKSRADYDDHPDLLRTSPNQGAVDGFPIKVYANGIYQGRYTINIPKDKWTFQMDDDLETNCALCGENYKSGCFREAAVIDESDWTDEIHDTVPASVVTRWNEVITFVQTSTDEEFKSNLHNYFNVGSLIDYLLFGLASCGLDAFAKNQIYLTYDGQIWYASMYDMDSTWGLYYTGAKFVATDYSRTEFEDYVNTDGGNLLYARLAELFTEAIQERWAELRNGPLTIANIINRFERFTDIAPPYLVEEDYAVTTASGAFVNIPSKDTNNIQQIRDYAVKRLAYVDEYIANGLTDEDVTTNVPIYELPAEKTFNASSDYIDTGVKLFETAKDFTIVLDGNLGLDTTNNNGDCVIQCTTIGSNKRGISLEIGDAPTAAYAVFGRTPAEGASSTSGAYAVSLTAQSAKRSKIVIRGVAGVVNMVKFKNAGGGVSNKDVTPQSVYTNHSNTLLIGAGRTASGSLGYFWGGTIYDFKVYEYAFSDDEVAAYFSETMEAKV